MSWENAFDLGSCTTSVYNTLGDLIYTAHLSKGQVSAPFNGYLPDEVLQLSITDAGDVVLSWLSGNGPARGYSVEVLPSYSIPTAIQVSGIVMPRGVSGNAYATSSSAGAEVTLTSTDQITWAPDPADITDLPNQQYWSVYMGAVF